AARGRIADTSDVDDEVAGVAAVAGRDQRVGFIAEWRAAILAEARALHLNARDRRWAGHESEAAVRIGPDPGAVDTRQTAALPLHDEVFDLAGIGIAENIGIDAEEDRRFSRELLAGRVVVAVVGNRRVVGGVAGDGAQVFAVGRDDVFD